MSAPVALDPERRKALLKAVCETLHPEREEVEPIETFLPTRAHQGVLSDGTVLVVGERGAGKTAVFRFLSAVQERGWPLSEVIEQAPRSMQWIEGFEERGHKHPSRDTLTRWAVGRPREELERFWLGHLLGRLCEQDVAEAPTELTYFACWKASRDDIANWVNQLGREMGAFQRTMDAIDARLSRRGGVLVGYDDLDRLITDISMDSATPLLSALINVWISMTKRHQSLRARIFLRPDLAELVRSAAPDATKLAAHTVELRWTQEDIFRVLLRRFGVDGQLREFLAEGEAPIGFRNVRYLGWMPPTTLLGTQQQLLSFMPQSSDVIVDRSTQQALGRKLAGDVMGTGLRKGYTHTWILNHSRDGLGRALPRVTLNLIRFAASGALDRGPRGSGDRLLHPGELEAAQVETGRLRLDELREQRPVIDYLVRLQGRTVPLPEDEAIGLLGATSRPGVAGEDGRAILVSLQHLGVVVRRSPAKKGEPSRIDVPDLFRGALGIRRRGGPLQLRDDQGRLPRPG